MTDIDSVGGPSAEEQDKEEDKEEDKEFHFIAVADRAVDGFFGLFYHYSLQYWKTSSEVALNNEIKKEDLNDAEKLGSTELLANKDEDWEVWVYKGKKWLLDEPNWKKGKVKISFIHFSDKSSKLAAVYKDSKQKVKTKWDTILKNARSYGYAEQKESSFNGNFRKWPNSKYQFAYVDKPENNSNVFVRYMVSEAGLMMFELSGNHPPKNQNTPSSIPNIYSKKPWKKGEKAPPAPTTHR